MPVDHIRYDILAQEALRGLVRKVLTDTAKGGLPGDHHFFITFDTRHKDVRLSARLREQYPEEMTIVLQHQFWDLRVSDDTLEVGLSFGGVAERLGVPFEAVTAFSDPSVQFQLQFQAIPEVEAADETAPARSQAPTDKSAEKAGGKARPPAQHKPRPALPAAPPAGANPPAAAAEPGASEPPGEKSGAEVVRLDRFRKK